MIPDSNRLRMRNVSEKCFTENQHTHITSKMVFSPQKSYVLWDNVEKYGTARHVIAVTITWHMSLACCVSKFV